MFRVILLTSLSALLMLGCATKPLAAAVPLEGQRSSKSRMLSVAEVRAAALPAEVSVVTPEGTGPHPLLVIAPAKEYTMAGPIFMALEAGALKLGYKVVRFNWGFVTNKAQPSPELQAEDQELERVLNHFATQSDVDRSRVVLAAKSFGSRVAMRGAHRKARGILLLTPNSSAQAPFETTYAPLLGDERPLHIVISASDPYGDRNQLLAALPRLGGRTTLTMLPAGDHNFKLEGPSSAFNEEVALKSSLNWLAFVRAVKW
jgi:alpha/beta superfamily hydrolase